MTTKFRVWLVPGKAPEWGRLKILEANPFAADSWTVTVSGNGADLEKFVRSRRDLFTLYERAPVANQRTGS